MTPARRPAEKPDLPTRILKALDAAGRPLTRGELGMFGWKVRNVTAAEVQAALDELIASGLVEVGREWDERLHREYITYARKRTPR